MSNASIKTVKQCHYWAKLNCDYALLFIAFTPYQTAFPCSLYSNEYQRAATTCTLISSLCIEM